MRKLVFNPPIPTSSANLLQSFANVKLANRLAELGSNNATQVFKVGSLDGTVDVPGKPGWIYMRAIYPDGTTTVTQCYVPTYEDGSSKVVFEAEQLITPRRSSDNNPTYWIYDGIPPTPLTQAVPLANSFGPVYGNAYPNDDGSVSGTDAALPNKLNVTHVGRYSDGVTTPLTYTLTDSGQRDPATGERLWYRDYTGPDYNPEPVPPGTTRPPQPPSDPLVQAFFDPCHDQSRPPLKLPPLGNDPVIPPIRPTVPRIPTAPNSPPDHPVALPKPPPSGFRPPPNSPPYRPPIGPTPPPPTLPPTLPPPTGPGLPPPPGGGGGGGGTGGGGNPGGSWFDDGTFINGCFGVPYTIDSQIVTSNDTTDPNAVGATIRRSYYNIRPQIDSAIKKLIANYKPADLISVTLTFDGIDEVRSTRTYLDGSYEYTEGPYLQPRLYQTSYADLIATDATIYFDEPAADSYHTVDMPPSATLTTQYKLFAFVNAGLGSDLDPVGCDPIHYSYTLNTLPAYDGDMLTLIGQHPGYRLYLSCFKVKKPGSTPPRTFPYIHDFSDGRDGWTEGFEQTTPLGMALGGTGFNSPGPFMASNWISGWTVTIKGWSDKADDLFGTTVLSRGEFGISIMDGSGNVLASSSKNMYPPYTRHGGFYEDKPATFTWSFDNPEGALYSPCIDYYFSVGGGSVIYFQYLKAVEVTPIYGANPAPPEQPPESGPGTTGGSGGSGGSTDPNLPRNGSGAPIPKGTPLTAPTPPDSGDGSDGRGTPKTGPASGGPTGRPAVGFAPDEVPADGPVDIQSSGNLDGFEGLTPGLPVYLDPASSGGITQTKPSCAGCIQQELGTAADSTSIDIEIGPAIKRL